MSLLFLLTALGAAISATVTAVPISVVTSRDGAAACSVSVVAEDASEHAGPCGTQIDVVRPAYAFAETATEISPLRVRLAGAARARIGTFQPKGFLRIVAPDAGYVEVISLVSPQDGDALQSIFERRASANAPIAVPQGRAVAFVFDHAGRLVEISDPIEVRSLREVVWRSQPARRRTVLLARITRDAAATTEKDSPTVAAIDSAGSHPPDAFVAGSGELAGVWYGVHPGMLRVTAASTTMWIRNASAAVVAGAPSTVTAALVPMPNLSVALDAGPDVAPRSIGNLQLDVMTAAEPKNVRRRIPVEIGRTYTLEAVPPDLLVVRLRSDSFTVAKTIDLSSGDDRSMTLRLQPLVITGTLFRGEQPAAGEVIFEGERDVVARTDDGGQFEATLWEPRRYVVSASITGETEARAFRQEVPLTASRHFDIHVPSNSIVVRVVDHETGAPVEGASISVANRWAGEASAMVFPATAALTPLPPLRPGTAEISVHAAGYADPPPVAFAVDEMLSEKTLLFELTRSAEKAAAFTIRLPDGSAAAHAEVGAWAGERMLWRGDADEQGLLSVPATVASRQLIIRHPAAASAIVIFSDTGANTVRLDPAAPPLVIRVVTADGTPVGPAPARITVWPMGGVRLTGAAAAFATWSLAATAPDGVTIMRGLPLHAARVLATRRAGTTEIESGAWDSAPTVIPYPWSGVSIVPVADQ